MPNPEMTSLTFRKTLMTHLLLWCNVYAQIIKNSKGEIVELWTLLLNKIEIERDKGTRKLIYRYLTDSGEVIL